MVIISQQYCTKQQDIRVVTRDISKAFDRVWHSGLLDKLKRNGIHGNLLSWFKSYLSEGSKGCRWWSELILDGRYCRCSPKVSLRSTFIFYLCLIYDITAVVQSDIHLFADDNILCAFMDNPINFAKVLNHDLSKMIVWANESLYLKISPSLNTLKILQWVPTKHLTY